MSCNTWISLASGFLSLDQGSLLFGDFRTLGVIIYSSFGSGSLVCSFLSSAFSFLLLESVLLLLDSFLLGFLLLEHFNMLGQVLVNGGHGAFFLGIEVGLASKEAKQAVEVVINALGLLHARHEQPVEFVGHLSYLKFHYFIYRKF